MSCSSKKLPKPEISKDANSEQQDFGFEPKKVPIDCGSCFHPICGYQFGFYNELNLLDTLDITGGNIFVKYEYKAYCCLCTNQNDENGVLSYIQKNEIIVQTTTESNGPMFTPKTALGSNLKQDVAKKISHEKILEKTAQDFQESTGIEDTDDNFILEKKNSPSKTSLKPLITKPGDVSYFSI